MARERGSQAGDGLTRPEHRCTSACHRRRYVPCAWRSLWRDNSVLRLNTNPSFHATREQRITSYGHADAVAMPHPPRGRQQCDVWD